MTGALGQDKTQVWPYAYQLSSADSKVAYMSRVCKGHTTIRYRMCSKSSFLSFECDMFACVVRGVSSKVSKCNQLVCVH